MSQSSPLIIKRWPQEFLSFLTWCSKKSSWHRSLLSVKKNTLYCLALPPIRALLSFSFTFSLGSSSRYECVRGTGCKDGDYGKQGIKKGNQLGLFLFWTSLYQLLCVSLFFWADFLPWYGQVDNIKEFGKKYVLLFCVRTKIGWLVTPPHLKSASWKGILRVFPPKYVGESKR